jgi:hypothetical protein
LWGACTPKETTTSIAPGWMPSPAPKGGRDTHRGVMGLHISTENPLTGDSDTSCSRLLPLHDNYLSIQSSTHREGRQ